MNQISRPNMTPDTPKSLAAAQALKPLIDEHREALARGPDLPPRIADALTQTGLTQLWLPHDLGGPETNLLDFVRTIETLASFDGAVAWCAAISSIASWMTGVVGVEPIRPLLSAGQMFAGCGSGQPAGAAVPDGDGWRISGRWSWASFSRFSVVTSVVCVEHDNGAPRLTVDGHPVWRIVVLPSSAVQILSNWNGGGLRSSGSHDVACSDIWVPDDRTIRMGASSQPSHPLYGLPMISAFAIAEIGIPLGIAAASIDALVALASTKVALGTAAPLREQESTQLAVAVAKARLFSARAFAFEAVESVWDFASSGRPVPVERLAVLRMACWNAGQAGKEVVRSMYEAAGGTAALEHSGFAAQLRDVQTACQHINFATRMLVASGRISLGLEPGTPFI